MSIFVVYKYEIKNTQSWQTSILEPRLKRI